MGRSASTLVTGSFVQSGSSGGGLSGGNGWTPRIGTVARVACANARAARSRRMASKLAACWNGLSLSISLD
jgi:hypothetical protein